MVCGASRPLDTHFDILLESVVILPPHGIQLETHRGFLNDWSIHSTKRFIPSARLLDVVINEGIKGWNVLYYLVVVKIDTAQISSLEVAYEVCCTFILKSILLYFF